MYAIEDLESLFYYLRVVKWVKGIQIIDQNTIAYQTLKGIPMLGNIDLLLDEMTAYNNPTKTEP